MRAAATLARIRQLAIPPAYTEVWICRDARGHLQATGRDARGRKQYRYHPDWRRTRDADKFARMVAFATLLPAIRRRVRRDLRGPGLRRDKVLALVVALLDATRLRIGNREYARDNRSYGLTTLCDRHVRVRGTRLQLSFRGKGGAMHDIQLDDSRLAALVRRCRQLPGQQLFQYLDARGRRRPIESGMVNAYLKRISGCDFSAKDFRTWGATLSALARMACTPLPAPPSERALRSAITQTVREVAHELRNTPAVCRASYINPLVFDGWRDGSLHRLFGRTGAPGARLERRALEFLRRASHQAAGASDVGMARRRGGAGARGRRGARTR